MNLVRLSTQMCAFIRKNHWLPFFGGTHVRGTFILLVLGGTRCADDTGVNDGTAGDFQPILLKILVQQMEQLITYVVLLPQVAKITDNGLIWQELPSKVDTDKLSQSMGIEEGFFGSRIIQVEPVLDEMDAQHSLDI